MPLYNLLNSIEHAHRELVPTLITFWDIRRAFDSIPRNLQRLAWNRLGVPEDLAEWFVSLDDNGMAFVDTPYYAAKKTSKDILYNSDHFQSVDETLHSHPPAQGFQPQRGIGQGESASSLMWVAVYDTGSIMAY